MNIVTFGVFLIRAAGYTMQDSGATEDSIKAFLSCYRVTSTQAHEMYAQSDEAFENYVALIESRSGEVKPIKPTYYKFLLNGVVGYNKRLASDDKFFHDELTQASIYCERATTKMLELMRSEEMAKRGYMASRGTSTSTFNLKLG